MPSNCESKAPLRHAQIEFISGRVIRILEPEAGNHLVLAVQHLDTDATGGTERVEIQRQLNAVHHEFASGERTTVIGDDGRDAVPRQSA